jgi:hypothetical protein
MEVTGIEGLVAALALLALPFILLAVLIRLLPVTRLEATPRTEGTLPAPSA